MLKRIFNSYFQIDKFNDSDRLTLKHNIQMHIADGAIFGFAMHFASVNMIMPVFVQKIGGNSIAIGCIPVLWAIGLNFPQFLFTHLFKNDEKIKPVALRYGLLNRSMFLIISLFAFFFLSRIPQFLSVYTLLSLIFVTALTGSIGIPSWYTLFSKTTPIKLRGRLQAVRQLFSSSLGILSGYLIAIILSTVKFPENFAVLFLTCYILTMVSFNFLRQIKEPGSIVNEEIKIKHIKRLSRAKKIFNENRNFKNFVIADALYLISLTIFAFFAVYGIKKFNLPTYYVGHFTIVLMGSMVLGNIIFGYTGDTFGHKNNLILLSLSSMAASLTAITANNILIFGFVFVFMGCSTAIQGISRLAFVVEVCNESERSFYISLLNTITAPALLFGIVSGTLITVFGFELVFLINALLASAAAIWLYKKVEDPRQQRIL